MEFFVFFTKSFFISCFNSIIKKTPLKTMWWISGADIESTGKIILSLIAVMFKIKLHKAISRGVWLILLSCDYEGQLLDSLHGVYCWIKSHEDQHCHHAWPTLIHGNSGHVAVRTGVRERCLMNQSLNEWTPVVSLHDDHQKSIDINGLMQDCSISSANALEILQSCTMPSISTTSPKWLIGSRWCITGRKTLSKLLHI